MNLTGICLLCIYGLIRFLPFLITGYLMTSTKDTWGQNRRISRKIQKGISFTMGVIANVFSFLGMHYYYYRDFEIVGYVKNIAGLNFYHRDVEYFTMSASIAIFTAIMLGIFLRAFFCDVQTGRSILKKQQAVILTAGFAALILMMAGFEAKDYYQSQIVIGEICSNNESYILNDDNMIEDYVELYNKGMLPCQISDLYLSDDLYGLQKLPLEGQVIPSGGVIVIPCVEGVNSFSISNQGETIYLSDGSGRILEQIEVPELENDTAYVKTDTEQNLWEVAMCTPNVIYGEVTKKVESPRLSHESGFYDAEFDLVMESASDTVIYYTLDGSIPDEGSYLYEETIHVYDKSEEENVWNSVQNIVLDWKEYDPDMTPVAKAFLVRAIAVDNSGNKSDAVTATYFINQEEFENKDVVSLLAAPDDLFGGESGIYVTGDEYDTWYQTGQEGETPTPHFENTGKEWEREAVYELFESSESILQQNVGIRIQGNSTRGSEDKRFNVYTRPEYGAAFFEAPLFDNEIKSRSVIVHTSFIDALNQELMEDRNVPFQKSRQVSLFLNGEFWYEGYLREKYSKNYFEDYYGIDGSNLILYKGGELEEGVETDQAFYQELYDYVQGKDFSQDSLYQELTQKIDVQNYIDFLCSNIYCSNMDMDDSKNVVMFRAREPEEGTYNDGRWRFALYDMDAVGWTSLRYYEVEEEAAVDSFSQQPRYADMPFNQGAIYSALRQNEQFCKQFVLTFMDLLNVNFAVENVSGKLQKHGEDLTWLNSFFEKRPEYMKKYLTKEFELTGSIETVTLYNEDESKGTIQINTITPAMKEGNWRGEYYTDYSVTVTAQPKEGYKFAGWSGSVNAEEATLEIPVTKGGIELKAEFQKIE